MKKVALVLLSAIFLFLVGLVINNTNEQEASTSSPQDKLETFLKENTTSSEIAEAYRFAQNNPSGVLSKVKCYCGCLKNGSGHKNNLDCFFNEDGSFDLMGLNCGLCVKTALLSKQMLAEGKSVQEISDYVDSRWDKDK